MDKVWNPVRERIVSVLKAQINRVTHITGKPPRMLLLAGGLGGNANLDSCLQDYFSGTGITVVRQDSYKAWSATCRGGVLQARQQLVFELGMDAEDTMLIKRTGKLPGSQQSKGH